VKLIHCTDLHLNFLPPSFPKEFGKELSKHGDVLVITGDTAEHPTLEDSLTELAVGFEKKIYFVLGNHCCYGNSISGTRELAKKISKYIDNLFYLPNQPIVLSDDTILIGSDGWYDCRCGDPSRLQMSDFNLIDNFKYSHKEEIIRLSKVEADTLAQQADIQIRNVAKQYKNVYFGTHVPPFPDPGRKDIMWDPWFVHISMGNKLADIAVDFPDTSFIILAGHRHKPYTYRVSHNMIMFVGAAEYRKPSISGMYTI
jgi:predicted phosphohydrolase